ncbi:conserved hypothetical protein [Chloroherpeton thalassium ATCC 35110]|uniref:Gas vesicle protein n=1 Tax=Chloroherpeton thalassium (strain ATCC 35110 / GB-78) TaxID=517418 RepID=B3QV39_CHLT3|nr:YtxH domain-containing protein [Chloroherpeton thalassium]ACF12993.1 conserved hypothetical protein [Chloroherpeton thalassium ATCC 35110]
MEKEKEGIGFVKGLAIGALFGAAAGTVIGLLFAPRKGTETQQALAESISDLVEQIRHVPQPSQTHDTAADDVENDAKIRAQAIIDDARTEAQQLIDDANVLLKEIKQQVKQSRN